MTSVFARSFDAVAATYATARPGYPPALFDALEEDVRPLAGARVLDVGAGTGLGTRLLQARGAHVSAVEPGPDMAAQLRAAAPATPLVRADGNALPFTDDAFDLVSYAQSWHWTDPARSVPEALRVAPALALWWNLPDPDVRWAVEQEKRLKAACPGYHEHGITGEAPDVLRGLGYTPLIRTLRWSRRIPLDTHLGHLASRSYFATLAPERSRVLLDAERAHLEDAFPDGELDEPFTVQLVVVTRTA